MPPTYVNLASLLQDIDALASGDSDPYLKDAVKAEISELYVQLLRTEKQDERAAASPQV